MDRDDVIKTIRTALKERSGKSWSVRGGQGTAWGWIKITSMPKKQDKWGSMTSEDAQELAQLLGVKQVHHQGESIPASYDYYNEYIARAKGQEPTVIGKPYWD